MSGDDIARFAYLALLLLAISGYFVAQSRANLGQMAQHAVLWGLIFLGVVAAVGLWGDIRRATVSSQMVTAEGRIEVPRGRDGHYHLTLAVNGTDVDFVIDTGASQIVLSQGDAERIGLDTARLAYLGSAQTANGTVRTAAVTLATVALAGRTDFDLAAVVNEGEIDISLLGMAYLGQFAHIEIAGDRMILTR